jgi:hypothetical protein
MNGGEINASSVTSGISAENGTAGGIAGISENSRIKNSLHIGRVSGNVAGGIVGTVRNSEIKHNYTESIADAVTAGGLAGSFESGTIENSAALGVAVKGSASGRIAGAVLSGTIQDVYAREDTAVNNIPVSDSEKNGMGRSILTMRKSEKFFKESVGLDFSYEWKYPPYYEYPRLRWEDLPAFTEIWSTADMLRLNRNHGGLFVLMHDIDMLAYDDNGTVIPWTPVGADFDAFTGKLDGNGYTIKNCTVGIAGNSTNSDVGLFGYLDNAQIYDLNLEGFKDLGGTRLGSLAGVVSNGRIERVKSSGDMTGGGLIGLISGRDAFVSHTEFHGNAANGGIASRMSGGYLFYSHSSGSVNNLTGGEIESGGLIGSVSGGSTIYACYALADIYAAGGASVTAGGLAGTLSNANLFYTYYLGNIHALSKDYVSSEYNPVTVTAGGFAGKTVSSRINSSVTFAGEVTAGTENVISRIIYTSANRISAETSGTTYNAVYADSAMTVTADNVTGSAGANADGPSESLFKDVLEWDFERIWKFENGQPYPVLR